MLLLILTIPLFIIVYYYYRRTVPGLPKNRKILLLALRFIAVYILLLLLLNPVISFRRNVTVLPEIVFLTDNSYSMSLLTGEQTKEEIYSEHKAELSDIIKRENYLIKNFTFADGIDGERTSSNLSNTLQDLSERIDFGNVHKIFLLSDGWFRDDRLDIINRFNVPISTIHPEYETDEFDLGINRLIYNQTSYIDDEAVIITEVFAENYTDRGEVSLYLNDRLIDKQTVDFSSESIKQLTFNHTFTLHGLYTMKVEIKAEREGETNLGNNTYPGAIRVLDKRSGIYMLTDNLSWDSRYINRVLRSDDRMDVKLFVVRNNRLFEGRDQIEIQDVFRDHLQLLIIINNGSIRFSTGQIELIERFVGNGGGLLFIGKPEPSLEEIIAAGGSGIDRLFRTTMSFTSEANKYQTFSNVNPANIPPVDHYYVSPKLHPDILARFNNDEQSPAIIYNEYRQGRVLYMPFFNLWRWQMRTEGNQYNEFMHNMVSWLSNPAGIDFFAQTERNSYFLGESVTVTLTALDETLNVHPNLSPRLYLYDEGGELVSEEYLLFEGRNYRIGLPHLESGKYNYTIKDEVTGREAKGDFIISDIDMESRNRGYNYPLLSFISRQTGGEVHRDDDLDSYSIEPAVKRVDTVRYEIPLYRHWLIIALFLVSFCTELYLRKRWGLL